MLSDQLSLKDFIPVGTAFAGYLVAALHNAAANIRERRKAVNSVLYSLLEVRWEVKTSDPRFVMAALRRFLLERFGAQAEVELSKSEIQQFLREFVASVTPGERDGIVKRYSDAVQKLAPFYPLIAHRLAGEGIICLDVRLRTHYDLLRKHPFFAADRKTPVSIEMLEDHTLSQAFEQADKTLTCNLKAVSSSCGLLTRMRIRRMMKYQDEHASSDSFFDFLRTALEPIFTDSQKGL